MGIKPVILDTNFYTAFKKGNHEAIEIVRKVPLVVLNSIILGELLGGFAIGNREERNKKELELFLNSQRVKLIDINQGTAFYYSKVYKELRQEGMPIPTNDLWIAANAIQYDFPVASYDKHLRNIKGLTIIPTPSELKTGK